MQSSQSHLDQVLFKGSESWITLDGLEHLSDFKSHQDDLIVSF